MPDRQKKRNEQLANNLLGKNRRASAPGSGVGKKTQNATPGSLASRIGVTKVRTARPHLYFSCIEVQGDILMLPLISAPRLPIREHGRAIRRSQRPRDLEAHS